jgi:hypothetical protein
MQFPNFTAMNINRFVDSLCEHRTTHLHGKSKVAANSTFAFWLGKWEYKQL